jgi:hypothetical protein
MTDEWTMTGQCETCGCITTNYDKQAATGGLYIFFCKEDCTQKEVKQ